MNTIETVKALIAVMRSNGVVKLVAEGVTIELAPESAGVPEADPKDVKEVEAEKPGPDGLTRTEQALFYGSSGG